MPNIFDYWKISRPTKNDPRTFGRIASEWNDRLRGDENTENEATVETAIAYFYKLLDKHQNSNLEYVLNNLIQYLDTLMDKKFYDNFPKIVSLSRIKSLLSQKVIPNKHTDEEFSKHALYFHPLHTARRALEYLNITEDDFVKKLNSSLDEGYKEKYLGFLIYWAEANDHLSFIDSYAMGLIRENVDVQELNQQSEKIYQELKNNLSDYAKHCEYGLTLLKLGYEEEALEYFNTAIKLNEFYAPAYNARAKAYIELADSKRASEKVAKAKEAEEFSAKELNNAQAQLVRAQEHLDNCQTHLKKLAEDVQRSAGQVLHGQTLEEYLSKEKEQYLKAAHERILNANKNLQDAQENLTECTEKFCQAQTRLDNQSQYLALAKEDFIREHIELKKIAFTMALYEYLRGNNFNTPQMDPLINENFKPDGGVCYDGFFNKLAEYFSSFEQAAYGEEALHVTFSIEDETYKVLATQICLSYKRQHMQNEQVKLNAPTLAEYCQQLQKYYTKITAGKEQLTIEELTLKSEFEIIWGNFKTIFHGYYDPNNNPQGLLRFVDLIHLDGAAFAALDETPDLQDCLQLNSNETKAHFDKILARTFEFTPHKIGLPSNVIKEAKDKLYIKFKEQLARNNSKFLFITQNGDYKDGFKHFTYPKLELKQEEKQNDEVELPNQAFYRHIDEAALDFSDEESQEYEVSEDFLARINQLLDSNLPEAERQHLIMQMLQGNNILRNNAPNAAMVPPQTQSNVNANILNQILQQSGVFIGGGNFLLSAIDGNSITLTGAGESAINDDNARVTVPVERTQMPPIIESTSNLMNTLAAAIPSAANLENVSRIIPGSQNNIGNAIVPQNSNLANRVGAAYVPAYEQSTRNNNSHVHIQIPTSNRGRINLGPT